MKIGITGTRNGLTTAQMVAVGRELATWGGDELHHGDCKGADAQVAGIAAGLGYRVIGHPPSSPAYRAYFPSDETRVPCEYLIRDQNIVQATDVLVACPDGPPRTRSGTWFTVRYARKVGRRVILIQPDGGIVETTGQKS